jgi:hypothetical protein
MNAAKRNSLLTKIVGEFGKANSRRRGPLIIEQSTVNEVVNSLLNEEGWCEKFSKEFLNDRINKIISDLIKEGNSENAPKYFDEMIRDLNSYSIEQVVYTPLLGIKMSVPCIELGNVTLKYMEEDDIAELIAKIHHHNLEHEHLYKYIYKYVCSEFRIVAEPIYAIEKAEEETRKVIDLLRYAIPFIPGLRLRIGLVGEVFRTYRFVAASSINSQGFHSSGSFIGSLDDLEISPQNIKIMESIGIFKLSKMLQEDKLSDFKETILSSIHWFSNSQMKAESEDQLLNLITCLETILTPMDKRDPIIQNIAEGVAIIIDNDVIDRKKRTKQVRDLYDRRSSLSHHGKGNVTKEELRRLTRIALSLLKSVIDKSDEFITLEEFHRWIEYRKLGGNNSPSWEGYCEAITEKKK